MEDENKCDIGLDCAPGYDCDIPTHTCKLAGVAVTKIAPAPDAETERGWAAQVLSRGNAMLVDWKETSIAHETMVAERAQFGVPLVSGGWTQLREDSYQTLNVIVMTLAHYMGEVSEGSRRVAYDLFGNQPALIGEAGEMELSYANGVLGVKTSGGAATVDAAGFTGFPPAVIAAIVIAGAAVQIAGIISISAVVRDYINKTVQQDAFDHKTKLIAAGMDPEKATASTNATIDALAAKKRAEADAAEKGDLAQFSSVLKTALWVGLGVAIIGGLIYFTAPLMKGAGAARQLAQQNPLTPPLKLSGAQEKSLNRAMSRSYDQAWDLREQSERAARRGDHARAADLEEQAQALFEAGDEARALLSARQNPSRAADLSGINVVRLNAGNDANGNPRRVYLVFDADGIIAAVDEGYSGPHALDERFGAEAGAALRKRIDVDIATTPAEYRALRKNWSADRTVLPSRAKRGDVAVLHLNAGNDRNGNPRRVYLVFAGGGAAAAYDEGYSGVGALPEQYRSLVAAELDTTPAEYRNILKKLG